MKKYTQKKSNNISYKSNTKQNRKILKNNNNNNAQLVYTMLNTKNIQWNQQQQAKPSLQLFCVTLTIVFFYNFFFYAMTKAKGFYAYLASVIVVI